MREKILNSGVVSFRAEGRLLQELGERLVATPHVALVELVKNAFDADSPTCEVRLDTSEKLLTVADQGHGMFFSEFVDRWMAIATSSKVEEQESRTFKRRRTGAKGIGRFAVRSLGEHLTLITVADDPDRRCRTRLKAAFDWTEIDRLQNIAKAEIGYTVQEVSGDTPTGTTLEVRRLKASTDFASSSTLRDEVLRIVSPLPALDAGRFGRTERTSKGDPGFTVILPGGAEGAPEVDLAKLVLDNAWARLQIELHGRHLRYRVSFASSVTEKTLDVSVPGAVRHGFVADIRYFPRRKGVFSRKGINGRQAWSWVRKNCGVAVVDHGFRVVPYGYPYDDWLHLDLSKSHSERDWRSQISKKHFPIPAPIRNRPADNPALYLPYSFQLVGAVFVESQTAPAEQKAPGLIASMDREGFLDNEAFRELADCVRGGVEFLSLNDKRRLDEEAAKAARAAVRDAREDVREAIEYIRKSPTLTASDKVRIVRSYQELATRIEEAEEYQSQARRSLMAMSLLGVVAGFMTHETKSLVLDMERAAQAVATLARDHHELWPVASDLDRHLSTFKAQLQYAQMFLSGVRRGGESRMSAAGQIRHVLKRFEGFARDHGIDVTSQASQDVETPALPPPVYSGVLLNLYTNALKAVLSVTSSVQNPMVAIRAWNERGRHYLEVSDNGVGIPAALRKRIWDPLYTTTSDTGNPLGSGMGLGLTLVKQVVEDVGGTVSLIDTPPPGFTTCFRVTYPLE